MVNPVNKGNGNAKGVMFKSPVLEAFTRTSPTITLCLYIPIMVTLLYLGNHILNLTLGKALTWYFSGFFSWTLLEYFLHRYLFHFVDEREWTKKLHYMLHGIHHDYPRDEERLFMPPLPGLLYTSVFLSVFWLFFGKFALYFMPGLMNGYLLYSFTHWAMHKYQAPKYLAALWRHHNMHHYRYPDKAFGVSSPFWDRIFGTMPPDPTKVRKQ
jgi:sterol desaturase/sphingolipid hydroxylase (fatty acid hydroxylase superfamily)